MRAARAVAMVKGFLGAVGLLTRVPVRAFANVGAAVPWFPLVGGLVGLATAGAYAGLWHVLPPVPAAAIAAVVAMALTGMLHEDGLADCADGFWGGSTPERRREIMKDSRNGTFATSAIALDVLLRVSLLASFTPLLAVRSLVAAAILGRCGAVVLMLAGGPAAQGLASTYLASMRRLPACVGVVAGVVVAVALIGRWGLILVLAAVVATALVGRISYVKIEGVTGDTLGAAARLAELAALAVAVAALA